MAVKTKFLCVYAQNSRVELAPVISGSEENEIFFQYTPMGRIELGGLNEEAMKQFEHGKEYYIEFTKAE